MTVQVWAVFRMKRNGSTVVGLVAQLVVCLFLYILLGLLSSNSVILFVGFMLYLVAAPVATVQLVSRASRRFNLEESG